MRVPSDSRGWPQEFESFVKFLNFLLGNYCIRIESVLSSYICIFFYSEALYIQLIIFMPYLFFLLLVVSALQS